MRNRLDRELQLLHEDVIAMGTHNEKALEQVLALFGDKSAEDTQAIVERIRELARRVEDLEQSVQARAMRLLFSQQPVARDLRSVSTALNVVTDMERIADQAGDIAGTALFFAGREQIRQPAGVPAMVAGCIRMVNRSVDAFVTGSLEIAREVIAADDEVDRLFLEVRDELIGLINQSRESGEQAIDFIMIAKYLERIADHAVNIAEWVIFNLTGEHRNKQILY